MTVQCRMCGEWKTVNCADEEFLDWRENNRLIQDAMPSTPKEERELLMTRTCGTCFAAMFPPEEN